MKKLFMALLLLCGSALAETTTYYNISDDGYAVVPLPFAFPLAGQVFTNSFFFSNGVVGFLEPQTTFCCNGYDLSQPSVGNMNFAIYALQTDLIAANSAAAFYTTTDAASYLSYHWQNVNEYGTNNLNTFSTTIRPTGAISLEYQNVNVQYHDVTVGVTGNILAGQHNTYYTGPGNQFSVPGVPLDFAGTGFISVCDSNPLISPSCPGYAQAFLTQQCTINALYSTACPGYANAYFNQQCSINALYNEACPGYAAAYLNYQCSINALYSTTCEGYATAYYNQQCELDALYDRNCPGYAEAYALANVITEPEAPPAAPVTTTNNTNTVAIVADPVVNSVVTTTTTATSPAAVAAPVVLTATTTQTTTTAAVTEATAESKPEAKTETKSETKSDTKTETKSSSTDAKPTAREQIIAKRREAAQQTAVRAGAEAAEKLDSATNLASQVQVQNVVLAAMGYNAGFAAYSYIMPDAQGYKSLSIYKNQKNVDNRRLNSGLSGASDRLHEQLVNQQYKE